MFNKNILEIIERFYICTNLPIAAFDFNGNDIGYSGFNERFHDLFNDNNVYDKLIDALQNKGKRPSVSITCMNFISYTACLIDPKNLSSGIFIIGPHSCIKNNPTNIPYKPMCLMPNLVSLLYIIEKDINHQSRRFKSQYSYHVKKALDYMDSRYNEDISLCGLASYLDINKSYFCSILKKEMGKTFTTILNEIRIEKSKDLLIEDNSSILEIALASGFNNQNYYNIMFKKITGMTPLEFRKTS